MSFADSLRGELAALPVKKPCCRRAFAAGFLLSAQREGGHTVRLRCRYSDGVELLCDALEKLYSKAPTVQYTADHGHRYTDLTVESLACAKLTSQLQSEEADPETVLKLSLCDSCHSAFLRGAFLALGTVSDPHKASHMEFFLPGQRGAHFLSEVLSSLSYEPKCVTRPNGCGFYYKNGSSVEDLLTVMGAIQTTFAYLNTRIERDIRNNENRATNCVARNIEKSIAAATRQVEAIGLLMEHGMLETLDEPLRVTAMLRYRNPDASLDELGALHMPPISKSGLNHRLRRILDAAQKIHRE